MRKINISEGDITTDIYLNKEIEEEKLKKFIEKYMESDKWDYLKPEEKIEIVKNELSCSYGEIYDDEEQGGVIIISSDGYIKMGWDDQFELSGKYKKYDVEKILEFIKKNESYNYIESEIFMKIFRGFDIDDEDINPELINLYKEEIEPMLDGMYTMIQTALLEARTADIFYSFNFCK